MKNYFNFTLKTTLMGVVLFSMITQIMGCGQRGALYLPAEKTTESNGVKKVIKDGNNLNLNTETE
ncbi:MAG: hypothetical protein HWE10_07385 [Gammaproteobacteria bacterium]|nr:hypothetical protein [Gammaproteobacteria bacterium]